MPSAECRVRSGEVSAGSGPRSRPGWGLWRLDVALWISRGGISRRRISSACWKTGCACPGAAPAPAAGGSWPTRGGDKGGDKGSDSIVSAGDEGRRPRGAGRDRVRPRSSGAGAAWGGDGGEDAPAALCRAAATMASPAGGGEEGEGEPDSGFVGWRGSFCAGGGFMGSVTVQVFVTSPVRDRQRIARHLGGWYVAVCEPSPARDVRSLHNGLATQNA